MPKLLAKSGLINTWSGDVSLLSIASNTNLFFPPTKIQLAWSSIALGAPRSAILNSTVSDLEKLGLI